MLSTSKSSGGRVTPDRNHNVVEIAPGKKLNFNLSKLF
jgi:hypothetical protein